MQMLLTSLDISITIPVEPRHKPELIPSAVSPTSIPSFLRFSSHKWLLFRFFQLSLFIVDFSIGFKIALDSTCNLLVLSKNIGLEDLFKALLCKAIWPNASRLHPSLYFTDVEDL